MLSGSLEGNWCKVDGEKVLLPLVEVGGGGCGPPAPAEGVSDPVLMALVWESQEAPGTRLRPRGRGSAPWRRQFALYRLPPRLQSPVKKKKKGRKDSENESRGTLRLHGRRRISGRTLPGQTTESSQSNY